jgi:hypothetical protein
MTFRFIAETRDRCRISDDFANRESAVQFGRDNWARIKRANTQRCMVIDSTGKAECLWSAPADPRNIPVGKYANDGKRYRVTRPATGKWSAWTFVATGSDYHDSKTLAMVAPDGHVVKPHAVLTAICADPAARAAEYGQITGQCAMCGRVLEDPQSRQRGLGPICAGKFG